MGVSSMHTFTKHVLPIFPFLGRDHGSLLHIPVIKIKYKHDKTFAVKPVKSLNKKGIKITRLTFY